MDIAATTTSTAVMPALRLTTLKNVCLAVKYSDTRLKLLSFLTWPAVLKAALLKSVPSNDIVTPVAQL